MSIVSLQIGQCGNQLGAELFNTVYDDCLNQQSTICSPLELAYVNDSLSTFFHECSNGSFEARCVQVDMEEKAINRLRRACRRRAGWKYAKGNSYTAKCGSGNNWAFGFFTHGQRIECKLEGMLRRQLERCDALDGVLATMSLAGGTGSGVGTKLLLSVPDILPKVPVLSQLVWPYRRGEVSVQAYNAILTLGCLLSSNTSGHLDAFLMHHNDLLHSICAARLGASNPNVAIGVDQLNRLASHQLAGLLQPVHSSSGAVLRRRLSSLLVDVSGHPDYRLVQVRCLPYFGPECRDFATETWAQLARHGRQMLLTGSCSEDKLDWSLTSTGTNATERLKQSRLPLLACSAVLRGPESEAQCSDPGMLWNQLTHGLFDPNRKLLYTPRVRFHARSFLGYPRSLFIASNGGGTRPGIETAHPEHCGDYADTSSSLRYALNRAWDMFASKAYLHQYKRYGLSVELMMDCFANVEQTAHCYSNLTWT